MKTEDLECIKHSLEFMREHTTWDRKYDETIYNSVQNSLDIIDREREEWTPLEGDFLGKYNQNERENGNVLKFDTGEICNSDDKWPLAIVTHFKARK